MTHGFKPAPPLQGRTRRAALQTASACITAGAAPWVLAQGSATSAPATLQIVGPWEFTSLSPASSGYMLLNLQVCETLLGASDNGRPQPALAERWQVSADGLSWQFVLRPRARFHNGERVTAQAVVQSLQRAQKAPALLSNAPIASITAEDAAEGGGTVRIRLSRPHNALAAQLAHYSTLVLAPESHGADGKVLRIIGSGPYRITRLVPPQQVETEAFEAYDGPIPRLRSVAYLAASRAETRALMVEGGQAHLAYGLDPASLRRLKRHARVGIASVTLPRTVIVKLNATLPSLRDVRVRQALSLSIDRAGIAQALMGDETLAATQLLPPTLADWHHPALPPLGYDPEAAQRLLREAGWQRHHDGLRGPDGLPLTLAIRTFLDRPELPLVATALQEQWRLAGIAVKVRIGNSGDIPMGHRDGTLQLALAARNYTNVPDPAGTLAGDFSAQGGDWGAMGWHSDAVVQALAELMRSAPEARRAQALRATVTQVLQSELPVIPVAWYRQHVAVNRRLQGVSLDPLERSYRLSDMDWSNDT
ncbi:ABC transporter substrate-binding protein [Acidovorax sp. BL-A-41-H1]|uniref:ABC transporter substrate-binding protein n=1 Tax=Acidovorax sp. BL-A-41-H1 TaxID=3421102 RepID=UPI003F79E873